MINEPHPPGVDAEQHNREIHENAKLWKAKPILAKVYGEFYREVADRLDRSLKGLIVELGSGMGNAKSEIPDCITTDIFPNPWLDRVENAYALSFLDGEVSNLILFDVWHHLEFPGTALREFQRVLTTGGRLIILDPAMGLLGRLVYGRFHHEPLGVGEEIRWDAPEGFSPAEAPYFAAQARASQIFESESYADQLTAWIRDEVTVWSALAYLGAGGFRGPQLYPEILLPVLRSADRILSLFPTIFGSRMIVVLSKK